MNYTFKNLTIALVLCIVFIALSFLSDLLNIIMYLDGGLLGSLAKLISKNATQNISVFNYVINMCLGILFLVLFVRSKNIFGQTIFGILSLVFIFSFLLFLNHNPEQSSSEFDDFLIKSALYSSGLLFLTALIKIAFARSS